MNPLARQQRRGAIALLVFVALALGTLSGVLITTGLDWVPYTTAQTSQPGSVEPSSFLISTQENFRDLVAAVRPAVVSIEAEGVEVQTYYELPFEFEDPFDRFFGDLFERRDRDRDRDREEERQRTFRSTSAGSGFLIDPDGYILTNNHVVSGAEEITVVLDDGSRLEAVIIGTDPETDVAVLKIEDDAPLPYIEMGDSDALQVGDWVMAIGNPFGTLAGSVTVGIVSAKHRENLQLPAQTHYKDFIQTDAAINLGNSGGPLVDIYGRAVGINTAITARGSGIGFAIPINLAKFVYEHFRETGEVVRGWIGVTIQNLDPDLADHLGLSHTRGALIADVIPDDPADEAGLQDGDVVLEVNGQRVESMDSVSRFIAALPVGEPADFLIWRDGREETIAVTPSRRDESRMAARDTPRPGEDRRPSKRAEYLGIDVIDLTDNIRREYNIPDDVTGVLVDYVEPGGPAYNKGLLVGDIISTINHEPVESVDEYESIMDEALEAWLEFGQTVLLRVYSLTSDGTWIRRYLAVPFE